MKRVLERKIVFPLPVLVAVPLGTALVHTTLGLLLVCFVNAIWGSGWHWQALALPLILTPYIMMLYGISLALAARVEWDTVIAGPDRRRDYGERRVRAIGYLGARLHVVVFVPLDDGVRVISLRRANRRETRLHGQAAQAGANGR